MKITKAGQRIGKRIGRKMDWLEGADADAASEKTVLTPADFSLEDLEVTVEQDGPAIWSVYVTVSGITSLLITSASPNGPFAVKGLLDHLWDERTVLRERLDTKSDGAETDSEQARIDVLRRERKTQIR